MRLAVRGGLVVTERETRRADVIVAGERIEAVLDPGAGAAEEEIAAHGLLVLPGVVDAHVHVNEPGRAEWEGWRAATRGAAAGGVTTVADMPLNSLPPTLDGAAFDAKRAFAEREAIVDFALWGGLVGDDPAPLRELRGRGVVGVKAFMCPSGVDEFAHLDPDALEPALHAAAAAGLLVAVHAEDEDAVAHATRELRAAGRRDPAAWEPSRPIPAEVRAIECLGRAARIGGATVHVVHASNAGAVDAAARCRIAGARMTIETCPHYLTFDASDLGRIGPPLKCAPPVRTSAERERLWRSVREGAVDLVASDHSPCPRELKERGDIWDVWGGRAPHRRRPSPRARRVRARAAPRGRPGEAPGHRRPQGRDPRGPGRRPRPRRSGARMDGDGPRARGAQRSLRVPRAAVPRKGGAHDRARADRLP